MRGHSVNAVMDYYDRNTSRFLRFGGGRRAGAIHRKLWGPGVETEEQALQYIHRLLADWLRPCIGADSGQGLILDLGCGAGGTALSLARGLGARTVGLTLSRTQAQAALRRAQADGLGDRCRFLAGDFHHLPLSTQALAAYAIESFVHSPDAGRFFAQVRTYLRPGGRLVVVDDFLADGSSPRDRLWPWSRVQWVNRFAEGWRLGSLMTSSEAVRLAADEGLDLIMEEDLSGLVRLPRRWMQMALRLQALVRLPNGYWESLAGGAALQMCEQERWVRYKALAWTAAV